MSDKFDDFDDEFLPDELELKRQVAKLKRELKKAVKDGEKRLKVADKIHKARTTNRQLLHDQEIAALRDQIRMLIEKNLELGDACKVFAKGIENLKKEGITVIATELWTRKGAQNLEVRVAQLASIGRTNISVVTNRVDHHGYTIEALIISQYIDKYKKPI